MAKNVDHCSDYDSERLYILVHTRFVGNSTDSYNISNNCTVCSTVQFLPLARTEVLGPTADEAIS